MQDNSTFYGNAYGNLTVISSESINGRIYFNCTCTCGKTKSIRKDAITGNITKSCGCLAITNHYKKHGLYNSPLYGVFESIISRCYNTKHIHYKYYGGRGITICDEWRNDFKSFHDWANNNGWQKGLEVDRRDNDLSYNPNNCRIVATKININNRSVSLNFTINGETKTLLEWCNYFGYSYQTIQQRHKKGVPDSDLFLPIDKRKSRSKVA